VAVCPQTVVSVGLAPAPPSTCAYMLPTPPSSPCLPPVLVLTPKSTVATYQGEEPAKALEKVCETPKIWPSSELAHSNLPHHHPRALQGMAALPGSWNSTLPPLQSCPRTATAIAKKWSQARHQRLTSVTLVTWEAEIRRITVPGQPGQIVLETPSPNNQRKMDWRCGSSKRTPAL
jgi:hypothetical protein